ncbi:MAG TPA: SpoIID/LytB domain-containing protein [Actinomycetota bacterium]|nr:SpoIID/LytB domain-containing protein [Actinomycetota bacterium]
MRFTRRAAACCVALTLALSPVTIGAKPRKLGAVVGPVRLVPTGTTPIGVQTLQSYFGAIELGIASDGIVVSNRLTLERYLLGLNEVPTDWPREALRAQAVAARTYALWTLQEPRGGLASVYGFDICATIQCQVFSGADVVTGGGERWAEAVSSTEGLAVLYDDRPILARYHSTSGGTTFDNEDAFEGEPAYPYLKAVTSTTEGASSVYRWRVDFTVQRLQAMLERYGAWSGPIRRVQTVDSATGSPYPDVVVSGRGSRKRMVADDLRNAVRETAPALYPSLYPSFAPTSSGRLPETLPSERFVIRTRGKRVLVFGRGWGHGVGMSQWGAHGLAEQGVSFDEILRHYYTGVSIGRVPSDIPIEVGLAYARQEVVATGAFSIVDGTGKTIVKNAVGTWTFVNAGEGAISVDPPQGFGLPLEVGIVDAPKRVDVGEPAFLTIALSRPAEVRAETVGLPERFPKTRVKEAGKRRVTWLAPVEPGRYKVRIRVAVGETTRLSKPVAIEVNEETSLVEKDPASSPTEGEGPMWPPWLIAVVIVAAILLGAFVLSLTGRNDTGFGNRER